MVTLTILQIGKKVATLEVADSEMHESSDSMEQHGHHGDGH